MGRVVLTAILAAALLLVVGCANMSASDQLAFCDGAKVLRPAKGETAQISEQLKRQIAQHNAVGRDVCGWR